MTEPTQAKTDTPIRNWTLETDNRDIAWLGLRCSGSTNVLTEQVLLELDAIIEAMETAPPTGLVIYSHKESGFIAGADVKQFPLMKTEADAFERVRAGQKILDRLAALPFNTVAAMNGTALGGGLELALACDWRIALATDRAVLGLPEVQLGVHPGLGGTVRCVRLIGVRAAMELMLTGKPIRPDKAKRIGLIDRVSTTRSWRADAVDLAMQKTDRRAQPFVDWILGTALARPWLAGKLRAQVAKKANPAHYPAPYAIIDLWRNHYGRKDAQEAEARSFAKLVFTPTSQNLVRVFFLQDRLKGFAKQSELSFRNVHVIGAGTMGADIAAWCAIRGLSVTLQDREQKYIDGGLSRARESMQKKLKTEERVNDAAARLRGDLNGTGIAGADVIIEAIFENLEAKQALFKELERQARPNALLATNTSSIPLKQIAGSLTRPTRLVGLHFFNPVALMPLVEVVHSPTTEPAVVDAATAFVGQIGKLPLPCRGLPGFLVNRLLAPYMDEAFRLHAEGLPAEAIDKAATDFGMPVGPLELADSVGLDILLHVAGVLGDTINRELPPGLGAMVEAGNLGRKSGQGFYRWENGTAVTGSPEGAVPKDTESRLILSLVNEAVACVADHVVADADLADAGTIFGAGFAPFRGGPIRYARDAGVDNVVERTQGTP